MQHIEIFKEEFEGVEVNSISARDLHDYLEVKKDFTDWIKAQLELDKRKQSMFEDGSDYLKNPLKKGKQIDYILSMETAKHIAMMSKVKKGREVRQYFIKIEKQANKQSNLQLDIQMQRLDALTNVAHATKESLDNHSNRLDNLERNTRLENWQEKALQDAKNKKVYEIAGDDKAFANKLHRKVWQLFKKKFHLPRYNELKSGQYENGLEFIHGLTMAEMVA